MGKPPLPLSIVSPAGQGSPHTQLGYVLQVIEFVVDEGDVFEADVEPLLQEFEMRLLGNPDFFVRDSRWNEKTGKGIRIQEEFHRNKILCRGQGQYAIGSSATKQIDKRREWSQKGEPGFKVVIAKSLTLTVETLMEVEQKIGRRLRAQDIPGGLVVDFSAKR